MSANAKTLPLPPHRASLLRRIWDRIQNDDCFDLAAQTSFYFVVSLLPFCLVMAELVGKLPSSKLWASFAGWVVTYLPADSRDLVLLTIVRLVQYSPGFLSFGLLATLWSASSGFVSLMESLSIAYGTRDTRPFLLKHAIGTSFTLLAALLALTTFGIMAFGHWELPHLLVGRLASWNISRLISEAGRWGATVVLLCLGVDLMHFLLPNIRHRWRWISPGTVFVVFTLVVSTGAFNLYFQFFDSYPRVYGALGGFIILMLWIYFASVVLLIGAETDNEIERMAQESGSH